MTPRLASSTEGPGPDSASAKPPWSIAEADVGDTDGYSRAVAGVTIEAIRAGKNVGPASVRSAQCDRFITTSCRIGFEMLSQTALPPDSLAVASMESVPPGGSRWCNIDLKPGAVIAYAPNAEHTAVNRPGLSFTFAITKLDTIEAMASGLGITLMIPPPGAVHELAGSHATSVLSEAFASLRPLRNAHPGSLSALEDDVLTAMCRVLEQRDRPIRIGAGRRIDSRKVVHACVDYADALDRIPSNAELCAVAHVSERRLREAFTEEFDLPPTRFFRLWALQRAHDRLASGSAVEASVTEIAVRLGFLHLGRFAGHYKRVFGQSPSITLKKPA